MKLLKFLRLVCIGTSTSKMAVGQNVLMNILTKNSGRIKKNKITFLEVTICNTSASVSVPTYKLKPQFNFPSELVTISASGHVLPSGWTILSNTGSTITLSNAIDEIGANVCRTILISIKGKSVGGPSTISGNMSFSNSLAPGLVSGSPTKGDNSADNASTSTINVLK